MVQLIFVLSAFLLVYSTGLYPLVLYAVAKLIGTTPQVDGDPRPWPSISVLVAAYNEEEHIEKKIHNFLDSDYPGMSELIIASDGSTDRTVQIARPHADDRIRVFALAPRRGKGAAINFAVKHARGDLLVFTDANAFFDANALRALVRPFQDPSVGLVTGVSRYPDDTIGSLYQRYECALKNLEQRIGVIVTADGAIYALRRREWQEHDEALIHEFLHPIQLAERGIRSVVAADAICLEDFQVEGEFARQVRMVSQAAKVYFRMLPKLIRSRRWSAVFVLTSHRLLRWLTIPLLLSWYLSALWLARLGGIYTLALGGAASFAVLVIAGRLGLAFGQRLAFPYLFIRLNCAGIYGLWLYLRGQVPITWQPRGR